MSQYIPGHDIKEVMPMYTLCPICGKKAMNIYAADEDNPTSMTSKWDEEKGQYVDIVYTHERCK